MPNYNDYPQPRRRVCLVSPTQYAATRDFERQRSAPGPLRPAAASSASISALLFGRPGTTSDHPSTMSAPSVPPASSSVTWNSPTPNSMSPRRVTSEFQLEDTRLGYLNTPPLPPPLSPSGGGHHRSNATYWGNDPYLIVEPLEQTYPPPRDFSFSDDPDYDRSYLSFSHSDSESTSDSEQESLWVPYPHTATSQFLPFEHPLAIRYRQVIHQEGCATALIYDSPSALGGVPPPPYSCRDPFEQYMRGTTEREEFLIIYERWVAKGITGANGLAAWVGRVFDLENEDEDMDEEGGRFVQLPTYEKLDPMSKAPGYVESTLAGIQRVVRRQPRGQ